MSNSLELDDQFVEAARCEDWGTVRRLLESGTVKNVDARDNLGGATALAFVSWNGQKEIVNCLLENGANVDAAAIGGYTAHQCASIKGHKDVVEILLDNNADTNLADKWGITALEEAKQFVLSEIVALILDYEIAKLEDKLDRGGSPQDMKTMYRELLNKKQDQASQHWN